MHSEPPITARITGRFVLPTAGEAALARQAEYGKRYWTLNRIWGGVWDTDPQSMPDMIRSKGEATLRR